MSELSHPENKQNGGLTDRRAFNRCGGGPITFGVEIEAILAFEETRLQSVIDKYYSGNCVIVKSFPDSAHDCLLRGSDLSHTCRNLSPSWALQVPIDLETDSSLQLVGEQSTSITGEPGKLRPYLAEPLIIAKESIETPDISIDIKAQFRRGAETILLGEQEPANSIVLRAQSANYNKWTLTTDHTLMGCLESQLQKAVGDQLYKHTTIIDPDGTTRNVREKTWDSSGLELISPIFIYSEKETAFTSIKQHLSRISDCPKQQLLTSVWASLQVHVGLDIQDSQSLPIQLLQHLAYILICNEDLLSKLHPSSRSGLPLKSIKHCPEEPSINDFEDFDPDPTFIQEQTPAQIAAENESYLQSNDEQTLATEANYTGFGTTNSNARYFCHITSTTYPPQPNNVALQIFKPEMTLRELISLLQKQSPNTQDAKSGHRFRGYMYNFDNLLTMQQDESNTWKKGKPTIEFRQHACTTNPGDIQKWVELCFALVKMAQNMAESDVHQSDQMCPSDWRHQTYKYQNKGQWPPATIQSLVGEEYLGLGVEDVKYWTKRYDIYKDDRPVEEEIDHDAI